MSKIKIAVVGPGLIGKQHIKLINSHTEAELCAIVAPDRAEYHELAKKHDKPLYNSLESCIANEKIDGIIIATPNKFHGQQSIIAIRAGIPVLIEKPITSRLNEALEIAKLAETSGVRVLVGHHRAHSPLIKSAREIILSGRLGRIVSVIGSAQFYKPHQYFLDGTWRAKIGGGPILINLVHEIGNLRALCGEISAVHAVTSSSVRQFEVEDTVALNIIFENGALGTFLLSDTAASSHSWEQTSLENPIYPGYSNEDCYWIAGTLGSISVPTMRLKFYPKNIEPSWWTPFNEKTFDTKRDDPLQCQLDHFIEVIKGNEEPIVSALDGMRNLLVTEAVKESAMQGNLIYLNSLI